MMSDVVFLCPVCGGNLLPAPDGARELVCPRDAISFPLPPNREFERLEESRQLTSAGMVDDNLGSDQRQVIEELNRRGLLLSLSDLWKGDGYAVDRFKVELSQYMLDLGYKPERIELEFRELKRYIDYKDRVRSKELQNLLRQKLVDLAL